MVAQIFKSVKRLYLFFYLPTLSGDSGAVLTLSALPVMHHAQRQSQWQCKAMTKAKITPKPHTGSQRSRCKQNTRHCINKQYCNCQAYAPSHTGNPLFRPVYCICTAIWAHPAATWRICMCRINDATQSAWRFVPSSVTIHCLKNFIFLFFEVIT